MQADRQACMQPFALTSRYTTPSTQRLFGYSRKVEAARYVLSNSKPFGLHSKALPLDFLSKVGKPDVSLIHYIHTNVLFPQWLEHFGDATLFLFHVWMDIKVKRGWDIWVPQQYTYGFIVTPSFNATCSEAMTQTMILQFGYVKLHHQIIIVITIRAWLCRTFVISKHVFLLHILKNLQIGLIDSRCLLLKICGHLYC